MESEEIQKLIEQAIAAEILKQLDQRGDGQPVQAAPPADRGLMHRIGDNLIGYDDGVTSFGENVGSFLNRGVESATLGVVGDEAAALADATLPGWVPGTNDAEGYAQALAARRAEEERFADQNPVGAVVADIGGALVPGVGIAKTAAAGANLATQAFRGAASGAAGGGLFGFLESERQGLDRISDAPVPAALGGVLGAAAPALGQAAGAAYRSMAPGVARRARNVQSRLGLDRAGADMVSEAVSRDAPYAAERLAAAGPDARVAQMGPQTQGLLDWMVNRPGPTGARLSNEVQELAAERGSNFMRSLNDTLGAPQGVTRAQRGIMQDSAPARREAYRAAYSTPVDYASDAGRKIEELLGRVPSRALRAADDLMRTEGNESLQRFARENADGTWSIEGRPDVRTLDYITRALRDMTDPLSSGTGPTQRNAYSDLARDLRRTLDETVPEYRAARAAGQDAIANREAVDFGQGLLGRNLQMDVAEDTIQQMTDGEKRFAMQGVRSYVDEIMANAQAALTDNNMDIREAMRPVREITSRAGEHKLVALMGEEQAARLLQSAQEAYSALSLRAGVGQNSRTAMRTLAEERLDAAAPRGMGEALQEGRGVVGALMTGAGRLGGDPAARRLAQRDEVSEAVGRVLMAPVGQRVGGQGALVQQLPGLLALAQRQQQLWGARAGAGSGILGAFATGQQAR